MLTSTNGPAWLDVVEAARDRQGQLTRVGGEVDGASVTSSGTTTARLRSELDTGSPVRLRFSFSDSSAVEPGDYVVVTGILKGDLVLASKVSPRRLASRGAAPSPGDDALAFARARMTAQDRAAADKVEQRLSTLDAAWRSDALQEVTFDGQRLVLWTSRPLETEEIATAKREVSSAARHAGVPVHSLAEAAAGGSRVWWSVRTDAVGE